MDENFCRYQRFCDSLDPYELKPMDLFSSFEPLELRIQCTSMMREGKVALSFNESPMLYYGLIALFLERSGAQFSLNRLHLQEQRNSFSIPVPKLLRFLNIEEAGNYLHLWPKGTRRIGYPIIIRIEEQIKQGDVLVIRVNLRVTETIPKKLADRIKLLPNSIQTSLIAR